MSQSKRLGTAAVLLLAACGDNIKSLEPVMVSARVSGLTENGLGVGLMLRLNGSETITIGKSGEFAFRHRLTPGSEYALEIVRQPTTPAQECTIDQPTGVVSDEPMNIGITCELRSFSVGGIVRGLHGGGLALTNNGGDVLAIDANGAFAFDTAIGSGKRFDVAIANQPTSPWQTCAVAGGHGSVGDGPVSTVVIDCETDRFTIGGSVEGLEGTLEVKNTIDGATATLTANGGFALPETIASGGAYALEVVAQPNEPSQTCVIAHGNGIVTDGDITNVDIVCATNTFVVAGAVGGLLGAGLVLQVNGGGNLAVSSDGSFEMPGQVASGMPFEVTVLSQPANPTQVCSVMNGAGVIGATAVTNIAIACETSRFYIRPTVAGLLGQGFVLRNNAGDDLAVSADGAVTFPERVASGQDFAVTIAAQPSSPSQTCQVVAGEGQVGASDVESIAINCTTNTYAIGGTVSGLVGTVKLQNNGGDDLEIGANGSFAFPEPVASGDLYAVTVLQHPGAPSQSCTVNFGGGIVGAAHIASVAIECETNSFFVSGLVEGLAGSGLVLKNGTDVLPVAHDGLFELPQAVESGTPYEVTVAVQPSSPSQTCTVVNGSGSIGAAHVKNVAVSCSTNRYSIGGSIDGLVGSLTLRNSGGDDLVVSSGGPFAFLTTVSSGQAYNVTVYEQPAGQTCSVASGAGTVTDAAIANIDVSCVDDTPPCGTLGMACCSNGCYDGSICSSGNMCEPFAPPPPPPPPCGWVGMECCGLDCYDGSVCGSSNVCEPFSPPPPMCGGLGEDCCGGDTCSSGLTCNYGMCETACGYAGEVCCGDDICFDGRSCVGGTCGGIPG